MALEFLHRHPKELDLELEDYIEIAAYSRLKEKVFEEERIKAGNSG